MIYKHFKCKACSKVSTAGEWNAETRAFATQNRKLFVRSIQDAGASNRLTYRCPKCQEFSAKSDIEPKLMGV